MNRLALALTAASLALSCKHVTRVHPQALEHNTFGTRYLEGGDLDKAQHRFELALEYNADYPEPYNNLCLVWIRRGDLDRAKDFCIKSLRLNNDFAEAYNNLGYIYLQRKSLGKAEDSFRSALKVNPGYIEARYNLCLTLVQLKRKVDARVCYDKVIETNPAKADPYHDLCELDIEAHRYDSAIKQCTRATELDPQYSSAFFHLGLSYEGMGRHCDALQAYKSCVGVDANNAECRNNLDSAQRRCALTEAVLNEVGADSEGERSPAGLFKLGVAELVKGLVPEAERHFRRCLRLDGRFGPCHCQLAELSRQRSRGEEARYHCKRCLNYTTGEQNGIERPMCEELLKAQ